MSEIYEKLIQKEPDAKMQAGRVLTVLCAVLLSIAGILWSITSKNPIPILVILPLTLVFGFRFFWARLHVEYELSLTSELLSVSVIYGKRSRRMLLECDVSSIQLLAPDTQENRERAQRMSPETELSFLSREDAEDVCLLVYEEDRNKTVLVRLDADEELMRRIRFRKPSAVSMR